MNPIYTRLLEMAMDMGSKTPVPNTFFQEHLGLSSGRVSQLRKPGSVEKIGHKTLVKIEALGYSPLYIQDGVGDLRLKEGNQNQLPVTKQTPEQAQIVKDSQTIATAWCRLPPRERDRIQAAIIHAMLETEGDMKLLEQLVTKKIA